MRDRFNVEEDALARAAYFLALNLTAFNGIWRVNRLGAFNVPYGDRPDLCRVAASRLHELSDGLKTAELHCADFEVVVDIATSGDLVFLDPPYPARNDEECFTRYTLNAFGLDDQKRLSTAIDRLSDRGAKFVLTIADTPLTRELYNDFSIEETSSRRVPRAKGKHLITTDLLITNFAL
jgi:DNA adenine methylase